MKLMKRGARVAAGIVARNPGNRHSRHRRNRGQTRKLKRDKKLKRTRGEERKNSTKAETQRYTGACKARRGVSCKDGRLVGDVGVSTIPTAVESRKQRQLEREKFFCATQGKQTSYKAVYWWLVNERLDPGSR